MRGERQRAQRRLTQLWALLVALFVTCFSGRASAHGFAPALLYLEQISREELSAELTLVPAKTVADTPTSTAGVQKALAIVPPEGCALRQEQPWHDSPGGMRRRDVILCPGGALPKKLKVAGMGKAGRYLVVRFGGAKEHLGAQVLEPGAGMVNLSDIVPSPSRTVADFLFLGVKHIAEGFDHLAFVLLLALWARGPRQVFITLTAFTLGHSLSLGAGLVDLVRVNQGAVEVLIAGSIALLGLELLRGAKQAARRPWLMALGSGLLHGLGFAEGLKAWGLTKQSFWQGLLGFNLGVELGQLVWVLVVLSVVSVLKRGAEVKPERVVRLLAYPAGMAGVVWFAWRLAML